MPEADEETLFVSDELEEEIDESPVEEEFVPQEPEPEPAPQSIARSHYHPEVRSTARRNQFSKRGQKSAKNVRP